MSAKQRLLEAAGQAFADKGFRAATIREICERAGANVAAVNYYFTDKEALYRAVFEHAQERVREHLDRAMGTGEGRPAEDRLREFIRAYARGMLGGDGPPGWFSALVAREMMEPTPMQRDVFEREIRPRSDLLMGIVRELLGPAATEERVRHCALSVVGQVVFHKLARPVISSLYPGQGYSPADVESLAEHIVGFSLAGVAAVRRGYEGAA